MKEAYTMGFICDQCKQSDATVLLTDIQPDGEPIERHLCDTCATQEGVTMKPHEPVNLMLEKLVKMGAGMKEATQKECPHCGISFGEFRAQGQLGCPHDYDVFKELLVPLIERAHDGAKHHLGKTPCPPNQAGKKRARISQLRRELEMAITAEEYEQAARFRDELKRLKAEKSDER